MKKCKYLKYRFINVMNKFHCVKCGKTDRCRIIGIFPQFYRIKCFSCGTIEKLDKKRYRVL